MYESDDDDFTLSPSSKLASIFNNTSVSVETNASLTYKAPKQPKPPTHNNALVESQAPVQSTVALAKVLTLWKLVDKQNISLGNYMAAIIGNKTKDAFELIIYQDKTKILIRQALCQSFTIYKYPNNFLAFYDFENQLWQLNFHQSDHMNEFLEYFQKCNCKIVEPEPQSTQTDENKVKMPDDKEKILSRISKLGQAIMPRVNKTNQSSELSDSESSQSESLKPPAITPRKFRRSPVNHQYQESPEYNNNSFQMMMAPSNVLYTPDFNLYNFVLAQNAELKANLAEINSKLTSVLSSGDKNGNWSELNSKVKCQSLKIDNLQTELERSTRKNMEINAKTEQITKMEAEIQDLRKEIDALRSANERKGTTIEILEKQLQEQDKVIEANNELKKEETVKVIKEAMSEAFQSVMGNFEENASYNTRDIRTVLQDNLKKTGYKLMNSLS